MQQIVYQGIYCTKEGNPTAYHKFSTGFWKRFYTNLCRSNPIKIPWSL